MYIVLVVVDAVDFGIVNLPSVISNEVKRGRRDGFCCYKSLRRLSVIRELKQMQHVLVLFLQHDIP
jgi:hypothetical protein